MKISIVMPSFNQRAFLEPAVRSVLDQHGGFDLELLVIDGGSSDGSADYLRGVGDPRMSWTSAPDGGQSDAVNRGLARATGDIVGWLNSDDLYTPGALAMVATQFAQHPQHAWLVGRCDIIDAAGRRVRRAVTRYKNRGLRRYSFTALLRENFISQMGVFWRRQFGREVGQLDTTLHYAMDYDLWLRMAARSDPLIVAQTVAQFRLYSQSKTGQARRAQFDEQYRVAQRYWRGGRWARRRCWLHNRKLMLATKMLRAAGT